MFQVGIMPRLAVFAGWGIHDVFAIVLVRLENRVLDAFASAVSDSLGFDAVITGWFPANLNQLEPACMLAGVGTEVVHIDIPSNAVRVDGSEFCPVAICHSRGGCQFKGNQCGGEQFFHDSYFSDRCFLQDVWLFSNLANTFAYVTKSTYFYCIRQHYPVFYCKL